MGFFFRKRIKILPGVYMNLSKGGIGFSTGIKGCKISVNPKGETYLNAGNNGFYVREKLSNNSEGCHNANNIPAPIENDEEIQDMVKIGSARAMSYFQKIKALNDLNLQGIINDAECENMKKQIEGGNPQDRNNITETNVNYGPIIIMILGLFLLLLLFISV